MKILALSLALLTLPACDSSSAEYQLTALKSRPDCKVSSVEQKVVEITTKGRYGETYNEFKPWIRTHYTCGDDVTFYEESKL